MELSQSSPEFKQLVNEYRAETLPTEVSNVLLDFFMQKQSSSSSKMTISIESYSEIASIANSQCAKVQDEEDQATPNHTEVCDAFSGVSTVKSITDVTAVDIPEQVVSICDRFYEQYFADGCGCVRGCHQLFNREVAFQAHLDALELDQYCPSHVNHQHLLLLGAMNALVKDHHATSRATRKPLESNKERTNSRTFFKFRGQDVCRKFFLFVFGCGEKRIKNVMKQFSTVGVLPSQHENAGAIKALVKTDPNVQRREALIFILNYAQQNALQLPGRYTLKEDQSSDLYLLPKQANCTRRDIYERYEQACSELQVESISFALWTELWDIHYPNVVTLNDRVDWCFQCRRCKQLMGSCSDKLLNGNESAKIEAAQRYITHLNFVKAENDHYHSTLDRCRKDYDEMAKKTDLEYTLRHTFISTLGSMHYTFDWFTTISLPYVDNVAHRNSSIFFKSFYKVALFGVTIEPVRTFVLYIVPEFVCHQRETLPSITVSLMHHLFSTFRFNEKEAFVHFANNSIDQAKNGLVFSYFMWRQLVGLHDKVNVSYLPPGHTRCWNDLFMGVFKKKLRNCQVNSLQEIKSIAERCTLDGKGHSSDDSASLIQAFLVGNDNEEVLVPLYNWQDRFALINKLNPSILSAHLHFQFGIDIPSMVLCGKSVSSERIAYKLIENENITTFDHELPSKLCLEPLPIERRTYLYKNIRNYFAVKNGSTDAANWIDIKLWKCDPSLMQPSDNLKRDLSNEGTLSQRKKLKSNALKLGESKKLSAKVPKCSYCNELGHRESTFGKVRCPKKRADCAILDEPKPTAPTTAQEAAVVAIPTDMSVVPCTSSRNQTEPILEMVDHPDCGGLPSTGIVTETPEIEEFSPNHSDGIQADFEPLEIDADEAAAISISHIGSPIVNENLSDDGASTGTHEGLLE